MKKCRLTYQAADRDLESSGIIWRYKEYIDENNGFTPTPFLHGWAEAPSKDCAQSEPVGLHIYVGVGGDDDNRIHSKGGGFDDTNSGGRMPELRQRG